MRLPEAAATDVSYWLDVVADLTAAVNKRDNYRLITQNVLSRWLPTSNTNYLRNCITYRGITCVIPPRK